MTKSRAPKIVVLGSINMDLVIRSAELPKPGETVLANSSAEYCGGKGANQAVAAARAGGEVAMIGSVGRDAFADKLIQSLQRHNVDCEHVAQHADQPSGLAVISVNDRGQNSILVVPGANGSLTPDHVFAAKTVIQRCDVLLVQLEIPIETVVAGLEIAAESKCRIVVDPAPVPKDFPPKLFTADFLCPNESEATALTGQPINNVDDAKRAALILEKKGTKNIAITMGAQGTLLHTDNETHLIPAFPIRAVDSTAAGDAFAGALAVRWSQSNDLRSAVQFANAAGALAASARGAQASMANRAAIESLVDQ